MTKINTKGPPRLLFRSPQLAGRITNAPPTRSKAAPPPPEPTKVNTCTNCKHVSFDLLPIFLVKCNKYPELNSRIGATTICERHEKRNEGSMCRQPQNQSRF